MPNGLGRVLTGAVAKAALSVISRVLPFYVGSIFLVVTIIPWSDTARMARPYVSVLSALNSGLFGSSRMLMALARRGDAPKVFARLDSRGVPQPRVKAHRRDCPERRWRSSTADSRGCGAELGI